MVELRLRTLLEFAEARVPGTLARYPEVSATQLDALLMACPQAITAALPRAALDVLRSLGGSDDNAISVFGASYTTWIAAMLDDLDSQVLSDRFFRIAVDRNPEQMTQEDLYIDLRGSDGEDATLMVILEEWSGKEPPARGHTILSMATRQVFRGFELGRRKYLGYLGKYFAPALENVRWEEYAEAMNVLAGRMGLVETFGLRRDLLCYSGSELSLMFDALGAGIQSPDGSIEIWIGADSRDAFLNYAAQLRSGMPPLPVLDEWRS